jgi:hypothetical protein
MERLLDNYLYKLQCSSSIIHHDIEKEKFLLGLDIPEYKGVYVVPKCCTIWRPDDLLASTGIQTSLSISSSYNAPMRTFRAILKYLVQWAHEGSEIKLPTLEKYYIHSTYIIDNELNLIFIATTHIEKNNNSLDSKLVCYVSPIIFQKKDLLCNGLLKYLIPFLASHNVQIIFKNIDFVQKAPDYILDLEERKIIVDNNLKSKNLFISQSENPILQSVEQK